MQIEDVSRLAKACKVMRNEYRYYWSIHTLKWLSLLWGLVAVQATQAQVGTALNFDGVNDYVAIPGSPVLSTTHFTVEFWVKADAIPSSIDGVVDKGRGESRNWYFVTHSGSLDLTFGIGHTSGTSELTISLGDQQWHHVAGTYDGTIMVAYLDGIEVGHRTAGLTLDASLGLRLGQDRAGLGSFDGQLDDLRVWSSVRSVGEIRRNMYQQLKGSEPNLVGYWDFDDGSGTTLSDRTTHSNHGSFNDSPAWTVSGAFAGSGNALDFDGTNDHLVISDHSSLDLTNSFTIEAWIRLDALTGSVSRIVDKGTSSAGGYGFGVVDGGWSGSVITLEIYGRRVYWTGCDLPVGTWIHVAAVMDGSNDVTFYVDGIDVGKVPGSSPGSSNSFSLYVGSNTHASGEFFDGEIDELRIWGDVRTEAEIQANMYRTLQGNAADLVAYYRFDQQADASQGVAYDHSGNGREATLTNMDPVTDWVGATPFSTWVGAEDGQWTNPNNWSNYAVPTGQDVGIYAWNNSQLPSTGSLTAKNFYVASGVNLSLGGNLSLTGDFFNQGTFTSTGSVTLDGTARQTIMGSGISTFGTLVIDNASGVTVEPDITVNDDLNLTRGEFLISNTHFTLNGSLTPTGGNLNASDASLTIGGSGPAAVLPDLGGVNHLTLNRPNGATLDASQALNGILTLNSGTLDLNGHTLTLPSSASIAGTPGSAAHIQTNGGLLRREYASPGSFTFPVGDGTDYVPITLNFTSGTFASAHAEVSVVNAKHPHNSSASHYLNRYWVVNSSGISDFSCQVTATYADGDFVGTESELVGAKWDGVTWEMLSNVNTAANQIMGTVGSFSDFTAGEAATFPVEWLGFEAEVLGPRVKLLWKTASETNSAFFAVERRSRGGTWTELDQVKAAGFTDDPQSYVYLDLPGAAGEWSYRLRQVDLDGIFSYSPQLAVNLSDGSLSPEINVYPNPIQDRLIIEAIGDWSLQLRDGQGRILKTQTGSGATALHLGHLPTGLYSLQIFTEEGSETVTLLKE